MGDGTLISIWKAHKELRVTSEEFYETCMGIPGGEELAKLKRLELLFTSPSAKSTIKWALQAMRDVESTCESRRQFKWFARFALLLMHGHSILEKCLLQRSSEKPEWKQTSLMELFAERGGVVVAPEKELLD